ncbi:MAG TPA: hypothetical protein VGB64_01375 [Actinomycetota bacterium]
MMTEQDLRGWFAGRIPGDWFTGAPGMTIDRDEILIVGTLADVEAGEGVSVAAARAGRIKQFREDTREARIKIAREAEHRFGRKVSWGATAGDRTEIFTSAAVPHMTRLRMSERKVLDTLVESGIARSRSDALAWCVRLVGTKQKEWLDDLREALQSVEAVREAGPSL